MPRDPYEVLGVAKTATSDEINKAYRKLAKQYHPDRNPGDKKAEERFKEIQNAYEILNDPQKKSQYDQFGFAGPFGGGTGPGGFEFRSGGPGGGTFQGDPGMAEELFRRMFGGGSEGVDLGSIFGAGGSGGSRRRGRTRRESAESIEVVASVPFLTAALGGSIPVYLEDRQIDVKIPVGMEDGKKLRLSGQARDGGDVMVRVKIEPHPYFKREGKDILLEVPITVGEAILGGKVEVPTIQGKRLDVKIRPGTSGGTRMRLPNFGINGGDQYLIFKIMVPKGSPDDQSKQWIENYTKQNPFDPRSDVGWK